MTSTTGSRRANSTFLIDNCFQWIEKRLVDRGTQTREVNPIIRGDDHYTPERGPVR
jgi:hypothetical protein